MSLSPLQFDSTEKSDLWVHSHYSIGMHSPDEIADFAKEKHFRVIALTDYATVAGIREMIIAGEKIGIYVIPGIELNSIDGVFLGYFIDYQDKNLLKYLQKVRKDDLERIKKLISIIKKTGYSINTKRFFQFVSPANPSECHLARFLVIEKFFENEAAVFKNLLSKSIIEEASSVVPSTQAVIDVIRNAGGAPILARLYSDAFNKFSGIDSYLSAVHGWSLMGYKYPFLTQENNFKEQIKIEKVLLEKQAIRLEGDIETNIIKRLQEKLPDYSLHKKYFERMFWRSHNLSSKEFAESLKPQKIKIKKLRFHYLLDFKADTGEISPDFQGCPFILIKGESLEKLELIRNILDQYNCSVISEIETDLYREIAWNLYEMEHGSAIKKMLNLLKFNLDYHLYNQNSGRCMIFFVSLKNICFIELKKRLRNEIGSMKFYYLEYLDYRDIHFTSFIHIPDEKKVLIESWILHKFGITVPNQLFAS